MPSQFYPVSHDLELSTSSRPCVQTGGQGGRCESALRVKVEGDRDLTHRRARVTTRQVPLSQTSLQQPPWVWGRCPY